MDPELFGDAAEILRSLLPETVGRPHMRPTRWSLKVWFDTEQPGREHYEAQVIGAKHVKGAKSLALEIGFHAEHPKPEDNDKAMAPIVAAEKKWRSALGKDAVAGPFLGRDTWRRVSEAWVDPNLGAPDIAEEVGMRLLDYITVLEPVRRGR